MEILFVILKIIGIFLAVLLLFFVALILVPVRYRVTLKVQDEVEGKAVVHWLLHLVDVRIYYKEKDISFKLRIFGISLPLGEKGKKERRGTGRIKKRKKVQNISDETVETEDFEETGQEEHAGQEEGFSEEHISFKEDFLKEDFIEKETLPEQERKKSGKKKRKKQKKKKGFEGKVKTGFYNFKQKGQAVHNRFSQQAEDGESGTTTVKGQIEKIKKIIYEESNQLAFFHVLREVQYLFRHYIPGTISGNVTFSMGNPEWTGKALGAASFLPFWARSRMVIMPDFLSESFYAKGIIFVAGHIRFLHVPVIGIRLITDKNIRKLITNIRK